ncbi:MAG: hypothetical protein JXK05_04920 [Campylobacterales bacterium]|nr:hypothetical protein [Campylobacterales bacterium]
MTKIITSMAAAAVLASGVFAGTIQLTTDGNASLPVALTSVSTSLMKNAQYDLTIDPTVTPLYITYAPTVALGEGYTIIVEATNGAFLASSEWQLVVSAPGAASNDVANDIVGTLTDFTADANGNYTSMTFVVADPTNADGLDFDTKLVLNDAALAASVAVIDESWAVALAQGATADLKLSVPEVRTATALPLTAPKAVATSVLTITSPLSATFANEAAGNIIDVEQGRLVFSAVGTDLDSTTAQGVLTVDAGTADIKYVLDNALDTWTLTVTGDMTGINGMTIGGAAMTPDVAYPNTTSFTLSSNFTANDLTAGKALIVSTDSATILDTRTFKASLSIDDTNDNANVAPAADAHTLLSDADSVVLTINGYQAYSPYIIASADTKTYVKIVNDSNLDGDVTFDVVDENGEQAANLMVKTVFNPAYAALAAGSTGTYSAHDILAAAQAVNPAVSSKFAVKMTVNAAKGNVYSTVVQTIDGVRERVFQVYHEENSGYLAQ